MQSSLSFSSANARLNFQPNVKEPISIHPSRIKLQQQLPFIYSFKPSNQNTVKAQLQSQPPLQNDVATFIPPISWWRRRLLNTNLSTPHGGSLRCGTSSNSFDTEKSRSFREWVEFIGESLSTAFPIWVTLGCLLGLTKPSSFNWVTPNWTMLGLTLTMLGMGMTLTLDDLRGAFSMPKQLLSGFLLQYSVMPISGFLVSKLLNLPSYYAAGLILVACCPGGTASNIVTYIARGNVALSVLMTATSTVSAVVMTPFLTAKLAGQYVAVDAIGLLMSTLQVVLLPVLVGAFLNQYFQSLVKFVSPVMPSIAVGTVAVLCGNAIAQSAASILTSGPQVVLASMLLHASGFFFGYLFSRILGLDIASSRTISIEVGMQNSVLGVVLASQHFGNPLTAVPCAVSSVCHSILGSVVAGFWRQTSSKQIQD